ncbi:MAG: hypothetical protein L3K09_03855 [Thermoplasmata archaeon]|nr:hypothetical protein [Thermoplasmata archaeon]
MSTDWVEPERRTRERRPKHAAGSRRRYAELFGVMGGVIFLVALLVAPSSLALSRSSSAPGSGPHPSASPAARGPVYSFLPPFANSSISLYSSSYSYQCTAGGFSHNATPAFLNTTTGRFGVATNVSAHNSTTCTTGVTVYKDDSWSMTGPKFTATAGGKFLLRANWWLHFTAVLTVHPGRGPHAGASASLYLVAAAYIVDFSPFGTSYGLSVSNTTERTIAGTSHLRFDSLVSIPALVPLTKGHFYAFVLYFFSDISVHTASNGSSSASAHLD